MRKFVSGLLVLVLLASMLAVGAAGSSDYAMVTASYAGDEIVVEVTALQDTVSGQLTVSYDEEVLKLVSAETKGTVTQVQEGEDTVALAYAAETGKTIAQGEVIAAVTLAYAGGQTMTQVTVTLNSFDSHEGLDLVLATLNLDPRLPFVDVPEDAWFYEAVKYTYHKGWVNGVTDTLFQPNGTMTRAMFLALMGRMAGIPEDRTATTDFVDVKEGTYYVGYIAWAHDNGIVRGTSETTFSPNAEVTREQMATFLCRYAQYLGMDTEVDAAVLESFGDAGKISGYAEDAMAWAVANEIVAGTEKGLEPRALATRAQGTQILMNFSLYAD